MDDVSIGATRRQQCVEQAMTDMFKFFREGGQAAILDGANVSRERRKFILEFARSHV
jgi:hypothetical protein